jgi:hypothetical protein
MLTRAFNLMLVLSGVVFALPVRPAQYAEEVTNVIEALRSRLTIAQREASVAKLTPQMYDQLFDAAQERRPAERYSLIYFLLASYPGHEEQRRAGIATRHMIRYLVGHLSDSEASLRNLASWELYHGVPDVSLRDFTQEILQAMRQHPETQYAPRLVGKLGCASARDLLKIPEVVEKMTPQEPVPKGEDRNIAYEARRIERRNLMKILDVEAALARLGERDLEWKFIEGFRNRTKEDWWMWLQYLGYMGSPGCVVELARGFLEEPYYPNIGGGPPAWQRYAEAFHEALPYEPTFWFFPDRGGQKDYYSIRAWVKDYLRIEPRDEKPTARDPQRSNPLSQSPPN